MIVFTNGCFDILHPGHVDLLDRAKSLGTKLIVGINSDSSVTSIKGPSRPVQSEEARRAVLLGLRSVDEVVVFDETTPERLIEEIRPNVLVKGGDWCIDQIIGADFVQSYGGQVVSLPLVEGYSTSKIIDRAIPKVTEAHAPGNSVIEASLGEHIEVFGSLVNETLDSAEMCASIILDTVRNGKKMLICGNGGSAADAQHMAAEFVGRYETERRALPAIALTTDTSALTALANDYGFEKIFARQVEALAAEGDCLISISTSGNSPNVLAAVMEARRKGCKVIGMTGSRGKKLASLCDACVIVPSERTARIQEAHITIAHIWCEMVDATLAAE
ncbi:MAG: D-glycero-beta-D-manno-heptose 1-phosphate adenylyltransferase [Pyrinomonadaceae bacterium]